MARLPIPGGDEGNWGDILNDYLSQALSTDGKIKSDAIGSSQIANDSVTNAILADGAVTEAKLASAVRTKLNTVAGTPDWTAITNKPAVVAAGANKAAARAVIGATPSRVFFVDDYDSDPTGATSSDAAVAAAIAALGTTAGIVEFGAGTYLLNEAHSLGRPGQFWRAAGLGVTTIDARCNGVVLRFWDNDVDPTGSRSPGWGGGFLGGATVSGLNNTNDGAVGIQIGDTIGAKIEFGWRTTGFFRTNQIGCLIQSEYTWMEYCDIRVRSDYCETCFQISAVDDYPYAYGGASFSYNHFQLDFGAYANQTGIRTRNHIVASGITWVSKFNLGSDLGQTNSGVGFSIGEDDGYAQFDGRFEWHGENNGDGETHTDLMVGRNTRIRGVGTIMCLEFTDDQTRWLQPGNVNDVLNDHGLITVNFSGLVSFPSLGEYGQYHTTHTVVGDYTRDGKIFAAGAVNDGNTWRYVEIARMPPDDYATNGASIRLYGKLGGGNMDQVALWSAVVQNRVDATGTKALSQTHVAGSPGEAAAWCDVVLYGQADKSAIMYLKVGQYFQADLDIHVRQATITPQPLRIQDNPGITTPIGTEIWALSSSLASGELNTQRCVWLGQVRDGEGGPQTTSWVALASFPPDDFATNRANLSISGRLGGPESSATGMWQIQLENRVDATGTSAVSHVMGIGPDIGDGGEMWDHFDLELYAAVDKSSILYAKLTGYFSTDFEISTRQAVMDAPAAVADINTPSGIPDGALIWSLSGADKFMPSSDVPVLVTGSQDIAGEKRFTNHLTVGRTVDEADSKALYVQYDAPDGALAIYAGSNSLGQDTYLQNHQLKSVAAPTDYYDAATKGYVDDKVNAGVPWAPTANGTAGQIAYDANYIYVCTATNTWARAPLSSW